MADESAPTHDSSGGNVNVKTWTGGGQQFWTDELLFHDWRIQRHAVTNHCRLLDAQNVRHAWGTFAHCQDELEELKRLHDLPPMTGKVVIALHGLGRTRQSLNSLSDFLRDEGGYTVLQMSYASTRFDLASHAKSLAQVIEHLDGVEEINFVAHSLGNLVIRHYLADQTDEAAGRRPDPRIRRIVMLAPPNRGAQLAAKIHRVPLFRLILGQSAQQMATDWPAVERRLAVPQCQFGIIAGGKETESGRNPLLEGDDDLVVTVEETRLAGARDFIIVPVMHTFIMNDKRVQEYTLRFLRDGHFTSEEERRPLDSADTKTSDSR
jgi:pimeloyl-ACP methyl ester carboxylesterase